MKTAPLALVLLCLAAEPGHSATLELTVKDARESAIGDAVVWVMPKAGGATARPRDAAIGRTVPK